MKAYIARGVFLAGSLGLAALATAAWQEPESGVFSAFENGKDCPLPQALKRKAMFEAKPDSDNLLLLMYGLSQSVK
jgi:hypothetical protein